MPAQPARAYIPAEQIIGGGGAAQEGEDETRDPDGRRFFPFLPEHDRVQLRTGEEGQHDRAGASEELDPWLIGAEHPGADEGRQYPPRSGADDDLGQCGGDAQIDRAERWQRAQGRTRGRRGSKRLVIILLRSQRAFAAGSKKPRLAAGSH